MILTVTVFCSNVLSSDSPIMYEFEVAPFVLQYPSFFFTVNKITCSNAKSQKMNVVFNVTILC